MRGAKVLGLAIVKLNYSFEVKHAPAKRSQSEPISGYFRSATQESDMMINSCLDDYNTCCESVVRCPGKPSELRLLRA